MYKKEEISAAVKEFVESFPAPNLDSLPFMVRGFINNIIGDESPMTFVSKMLDDIPEEHLPKIVEAARKIVAAADGEEKA